MLRYRLFNVFKTAYKFHKYVLTRVGFYSPVGFGYINAAICQEKSESETPWNGNVLEHEFLIRQATTVNVNAATQLLTVTLVAIQDTSERLREALTTEICLVKQALEWGEEGTPPDHWDRLIATRGSLCDLKHNLRTLCSYMDYAEKLAMTAAEISYLSGNIAASDAICERIDHANRVCTTQKKMTDDLQQESLEIQQRAIVSSPNLQQKLKEDTKLEGKSAN